MQCSLHPKAEYRDTSGMLARQRQALTQLIKERQVTRIISFVLSFTHAAFRLQSNKTVFPGLTVFSEGHSFLPIGDIPGVREAGWKPLEESLGNLDPLPLPMPDKTLMTWLRQVHKDVKNHRAAWPFLEPVDPQVLRRRGK